MSSSFEGGSGFDSDVVLGCKESRIDCVIADEIISNPCDVNAVCICEKALFKESFGFRLDGYGCDDGTCGNVSL